MFIRLCYFSRNHRHILRCKRHIQHLRRQIRDILYRDIRIHIPLQGLINGYRKRKVVSYMRHRCCEVIRHILLLAFQTAHAAGKDVAIPVPNIILCHLPLQMDGLSGMIGSAANFNISKHLYINPADCVVKNRDSLQINCTVALDRNLEQKVRNGIYHQFTAIFGGFAVIVLKSELHALFTQELALVVVHLDRYIGISGNRKDLNLPTLHINTHQNDRIRQPLSLYLVGLLHRGAVIDPQTKEIDHILVVLIFFPFICNKEAFLPGFRSVFHIELFYGLQNR